MASVKLFHTPNIIGNIKLTPETLKMIMNQLTKKKQQQKNKKQNIKGYYFVKLLDGQPFCCMASLLYHSGITSTITMGIPAEMRKINRL